MKSFKYIAKCKYCDYTDEQEAVLPEGAKMYCWGKEVTDGSVIEGVCPDCQDNILNKMEKDLIGG